MNRIIALAFAVAVFVMVAVTAWSLLHMHLLGWLGLLPAWLTYTRVNRLLDRLGA